MWWFKRWFTYSILKFAEHFHIVDSYDNHAEIPAYFASVDKACQKNKKIGMISVGWDPGMFSINRIYGEALLPDGDTYTFWEKD